MSMSVIKQPSEIMMIDFDCAGAALRPDEAITDVLAVTSVVHPTGEVGDLTFPGDAAISGHVIQRLVEGGTNKTSYKVTILFSTDKSPVREADFYVNVRDL